MNKKTILTIVVTVIVTVLVSVPITAVFAEQIGDSPESGAVSRIKAIYDSLTTLGHGSDSAGGWGDWGSMWNRIYSAAVWTPSGTATAEDVVASETFYSGSRTQITGTGPQPIDFSLQQFSERDNFAGTYNGGSEPEDYMGEEAEWTDYSVDTDEVWKDERTGVYWSADRGVLTSNNFAEISSNLCSYFDENLYPTRAEYPGEGGVDTDCGDTINYCATLDYGGRTDWYLPSQQELMQAYIDGMYNQAGTDLTNSAAFTTANYFWSSSEFSTGSTTAWYVTLANGDAYGNTKTLENSVRCVSRD